MRRWGKKTNGMLAQLTGPPRIGLGAELTNHKVKAAAAVIKGLNQRDRGADCLAPSSDAEACLLLPPFPAHSDRAAILSAKLTPPRRMGEDTWRRHLALHNAGSAHACRDEDRQCQVCPCVT